MKTYLGIDLGRKTSHFYASDEEGNKLRAGTLENSPFGFMSLAADLRRDGGEVLVAMEPGNQAFELARAMQEEAGADVFMVETFQNALIRKSTQKTDRLDARMLAKQRRLHMLPPRPVYIPTREEEDLRHMIEARGRLVTERTRLSNTTLRLCDRRQYRVRRAAFSTRIGWDRLLEEAKRWSQADQILVRHHYDRFIQLQKQLGEINSFIEKHINDNWKDEYELLQTIPGVGPIVAATYLARVGITPRFSNARKVCRYTGIAPGIRQSGEKTGGRGITKAGHHRIRAVAVNAAVAIVIRANHEDALYQWYLRVKKRRGWAKARTALARKILTIMYGVIKTGTPYDPSKVNANLSSAATD